MLSSHYHHHKSKTFSQLTQCPFTGTLLLLLASAHFLLETTEDGFTVLGTCDNYIYILKPVDFQIIGNNWRIDEQYLFYEMSPIFILSLSKCVK